MFLPGKPYGGKVKMYGGREDRREWNQSRGVSRAALLFCVGPEQELELETEREGIITACMACMHEVASTGEMAIFQVRPGQVSDWYSSSDHERCCNKQAHLLQSPHHRRPPLFPLTEKTGEKKKNQTPQFTQGKNLTCLCLWCVLQPAAYTCPFSFTLSYHHHCRKKRGPKWHTCRKKAQP